MRFKEIYMVCEFKSEGGFCSLSRRRALHSCDVLNKRLIEQEGEIVDLI